MNIQIFGRSKCFDTKKAERYFKERKIPYQLVDLSRKGLSAGELRSVSAAVGGLDPLIDPKSRHPDAAMLPYLLEEAKFDKLLEHPELLCTPIVRNGRQATVGYRPEAWAQWK